MEYYSLAGKWQADIGDGQIYSVMLPGTLDENGIGGRDIGNAQLHPDSSLGGKEELQRENVILTRFTRKHTYEGAAEFARTIAFDAPQGRRVFLEVERARCLRLSVDGREVPHFREPSLSTPHVFEVTDCLRAGDAADSPEHGYVEARYRVAADLGYGDADAKQQVTADPEHRHVGTEHRIVLTSDNSYPGLPHDNIVYSSAATDETQTNWNGALGYLRLRVEEPVFIEAVRAYPSGDELTVVVCISAENAWEGKVHISSEALEETVTAEVDGKVGDTEIVMKALLAKVELRRWDEYEGNLYELTVELAGTAVLEDEAKIAETVVSKTAAQFTGAIVLETAAQFSGTGFSKDEEQAAAKAASEDEEQAAAKAASKDEEQAAAKAALEDEAQVAGMTASVTCAQAVFRARKTVTFGVRDFGADSEGRLTLNGRKIFLRGEANCAVYPETGYCPMSVEEWTELLTTYKSYGLNFVRFHSHCPPEAAFTAADRMGILMQPELSHWNPRDAFETEESLACYTAELAGILRMLANHPSFVMLSLGNELQASEKGHARMRELLEMARRTDPTRMYANGSNVHYGQIGCDGNSDFYTASNYYEHALRAAFANMDGYLNRKYPSAAQNFDKTMRILRESYKGPVFGFEVGQYEVLPDFDELEDFKGITDPANLRHIKEQVEEKGLTPLWKRYVEATGELSRLCYREEVEAVLRTEGMSGMALLGLQDFPGQGTALVGMLNSHMKPKPYSFAKPERFREFFTAQLPLVFLPRYTYENTETLEAEVQVANYGKEPLAGPLRCRLRGDGIVIYPEEIKTESEIVASGTVKTDVDRTEDCSGTVSGNGREEGSRPVSGHRCEVDGKDGRGTGTGINSGDNCRVSFGEVFCPAGKLTFLGRFSFPLNRLTVPARLELEVSIGSVANHYPIWVYPAVHPVCPENVYETVRIDEKAEEVLNAGGTVYLSPPSTKEALPDSIQAQFSTDFWSVGTFVGQEGAMGQLIDDKHPIFREFPTEFHTNWQWWLMASRRAVILPKRYEAIVTEMDSCAYLRPMAQLLECRCGRGKLLFSSIGLQELQTYPEARALLAAIYRYMASDAFAPKQEIELDVWKKLVR